MFRKALFLLVSLLFFFKVQSQSTAIGIKGGANASYLIGEEAPALPDKLFSYNAGVFMRFRVSSIMTVRPELIYSEKKYAFTQPIPILENGILHVEETNSYLTLPVMFAFKAGDDVLNGFLSFGPEIAVLLNHRRILAATSNGYKITPEPYYDFDVNAYDYGASVGAGFQIRAFVFDARYFLSLRPLYSGNTSLEMRYMNLFVNIGYIINYRPPSSYSRPTTWKSLKYKIKHLF